MAEGEWAGVMASERHCGDTAVKRLSMRGDRIVHEFEN